MNQSQHDELAQLFAQRMHVSGQPEDHGHKMPIHYISNHYTPTAHIRAEPTTPPPRSPPPSYNDALMPPTIADILRHHSIDPSVLMPAQIHLFQHANYEQRLRLLELWRSEPPSLSRSQELHGDGWMPTSMEQEEYQAGMRHQRRQALALQCSGERMVDTRGVEEPISPIREEGETPWPPAARMRVASITALSRPQTWYGEAKPVQPDPEPYMIQGYGAGSRAVDPVYAAATGLWQAPSFALAVQQSAMTGMEEQIRNHADWERMNQRLAMENLAGLHRSVDEDMIM